MVLCLELIKYLLDRYDTDPRVAALVDETEIWIMPLMNPDGYEAGSRMNAYGTDLNRDFPDPIWDPVATTEGREPETRAVMEWFDDHTPTLAASFHAGALVVTYPWDGAEEPNPDEDLFIYLAETYSWLNTPMWNSLDFFHGITQGYDWYIVKGGMDDWTYYWHGCLEVTVELGAKELLVSELSDLWDDNREAMLTFLEQAWIGVRGMITDADTGQPVLAEVRVQGIDQTIYSDPDVGDYHRMLLPGVYTLTFTADDYESRQFSGVQVVDGSTTILDITMTAAEANEDSGDGGGSGGGGGCFIQAMRFFD